MQPQPSSPSAEPVTLKAQFALFIASTYTPDPPSANDPHPAVREQYRQLRDAFYAGCLLGLMHHGEFLEELEEFGQHVAKRARLAQAFEQGGRS